MKLLRRILIPVIILLIFYFLVRSIIAHWQKVPFAEIKFEVNFLIISILFLLASSFAGNFAWCKNLRFLGAKIRYFQALSVIGISQMGKYIPGKVWSVGGRVLLARRYGVSEITTSASILIETITLSLSAFVLFFISLFSFGGSLPSKFYLSFLFLPLSLFFLHPAILKRLIALGGKILRRPVVIPDLESKKVIGVYAIYFISWFLHSSGFFFLVHSIYPVSFANFFRVIGAFSCAWVLSFGILFIPGGFGVREGILAFLLKFFLPTPIAALLSLLGRLWTTLGEVIILIIAFLVKMAPRMNRDEDK